MVYSVTIIVLQQLIGLPLCKESTASNKNYAELNAILHQNSKFLNTIVCCLFVTQCSRQNKELREPEIGGGGEHKQPSWRAWHRLASVEIA